MSDHSKQPPLVAGGQGRKSRDIERDLTVLAWIFAAITTLAGILATAEAMVSCHRDAGKVVSQ